MSDEQFRELILHRPGVEIVLALTQVKTLDGATRIYMAERSGKNRPVVLREAARRIAELGGSEPAGGGPKLVVAAEVVDLPQEKK